VAYLFIAALASTSEPDVQYSSPLMRPAAPETSNRQLGSAENSHLVLEDPVLVPNLAQSFSSASVVAA
jgi:hypothetical protein